MKYIFLILTLMFVVSARAEGALPTVQPTDFQIGRQWIWDYFDQTGAVYSTERYEVIARSGSVILIEIASDYDGHQNLQPNHRIQVDVQACLSAYRNPVQKKPWRFTMFYLNQAKWTPIDQPNTLAFEEKFNCNPREYLKPSEPYLTTYSTLNGREVFQQKLWRRLAGSWFGLHGDVAGISLGKDFEAGSQNSYSARLRLSPL